MPDNRIVVISAEELEELVIGAVKQALGTHSGGALLVDKQDLAQKLGCSPSHIDALRKRGLPTVTVSEKVVRFEPAKVLEWLRQQPAEAAPPQKRKPKR